MTTNASKTILLLVLALGGGCGSSASPSTGGFAGTGAAATFGAAGVAAASGTGAVAGTAAVSGTAGASGHGVIGTGVAGTTGIAGAGIAAAGAAGGTAGVGGSSAAGGGAGTAGGGPAAGSGGAGGSVGAAGFPQLPRVTTTDGPGPFTEVVKVQNTPPGGWLIYPKNIGMGGMKHPIFVFGPGATTTPATYDMDGMHWDRYGSYGFVIYAVGSSTMDGSGTKNGLDWVLKQNDDMTSPLYQKLDTSKVCVGGHSLGSIMTFAFLPDDRVTTSVHISGGSFDGMGSSHLTKEAMFMCGPDGTADIAEPQCETDYMNAKVPIFYTKLMGATHITSARTGWAATIAWMLWHLADQGDQWKKEFLEPTGQFQTGIYMSEVKNWP